MWSPCTKTSCHISRLYCGFAVILSKSALRCLSHVRRKCGVFEIGRLQIGKQTECQQSCPSARTLYLCKWTSSFQGTLLDSLYLDDVRHSPLNRVWKFWFIVVFICICFLKPQTVWWILYSWHHGFTKMRKITLQSVHFSSYFFVLRGKSFVCIEIKNERLLLKNLWPRVSG